MEESTLIKDALLALDEGLRTGWVLVQGGKIAAVGVSEDPGNIHDAVIVSAEGGILAPGFIDLHCHGGAGSDINDGTKEAFYAMEAFHRKGGVTAFMPTLSVDPMPKLENACALLRSLTERDKAGRAEVLGLHFESPYISQRYRGCQAAEYLKPFDTAALRFIETNRDVIRRITLAPELEGALEAIPRLRDWGIIVSGGHSNADSGLWRRAADQGMTMATHLYNAMSSVHKEGPFRVTGALEASLIDERIFTECIADGYHVPAELLQIAYRCKGPDRFMLCSDASRAAGYADTKPVFICGQEAIVENGIAMLKDRSSLASSVVSLDTMVRFLVQKAGFTISQALRAASYTPAQAAGVAHRKGRIASAYDADMVLLNAHLQVRQVWVRGREIRFNY